MGPLVNLQVKVRPEVFEQFKNAFEVSGCTTQGQFVEAVMEFFLNPPKGKQIEVSKAEDQQQIENLTNEIGRLKILIDQKDDEIQSLKDQIQEAAGSIQSLESSIPGQNQHVITIEPIIKRLLEIEAEYCKKKTGKEFSITDILKNSFWESIKEGRVSPFRQWSAAELRQLAKQLQES